MADALTVARKGDLVVITAIGLWDRDCAMEAQARAVRLVEAGDVRGVLVDLGQAVMDGGTFDIYEVTASHARAFPLALPQAVVVPESFGPKDRRFYEDVAANRGMIHRAFGSLAEARAWLAERPRG